jgi:hippurate hydrolase
MQDQERLESYRDEAIRLRRALHQIPEEGFKLEKTQAYIIDYLKKMGYVPEKVGDSGIVLYIKGENEADVIAFRADMDALCIREEADHDYVSRHPGMMHACGHDGHMTMNLLLAKYLFDHPEAKKRSVLLIFQPAEEGPGGAKPMVEAGILTKYHVKAIFGYHLFPFIKEGILGTTDGPMMAKNSEFFITVHGVSGHAAEPQLAVDAIVASASLVTSIQSIISRNSDPLESAVISIGLLHGGTRVNVVAEEVQLGGTIRSFSMETHRMIHRRLAEIVQGVELAYGCRIELKFVDMYPPVINDPLLYRVFLELCEPEECEKIQKIMLSEDFAFFQKEIPGLFIGLGTRNTEKGFVHDLHKTEFNFDESVLLTGVGMSLKFINYSKDY